MSDRTIDAASARLIFHADPLAAAIVPLAAAVILGGMIWLIEGRFFALMVCAGIGLFAVIDQVQLRLRPPLVIEGHQVTVRPRRGGEIRFDGRSIAAVEMLARGALARGVVVRPGLPGGGGATTATFIGPLRDPTAAWHALDRLRRTGGR